MAMPIMLCVNVGQSVLSMKILNARLTDRVGRLITISSPRMSTCMSTHRCILGIRGMHEDAHERVHREDQHFDEEAPVECYVFEIDLLGGIVHRRFSRYRESCRLMR
jgi:hypothetical protein